MSPRVGTIAAAALLVAPAAGPAYSQSSGDVTSVLARAEAAYEKLTTLEAEFRQTIVNPMLGGPEHSRGVLYLERPDRFAMRFTDPAGDRIVVDGTWLWTYAPSSVPNQVIKQPAPRYGTATPNLIGQFVERPLERYQVDYVGADTAAGTVVDLVRLVPRSEALGFTEATIAVAREDGLLRRIALREESGQRRTLVFTRIRVNAPIPRREVSFEVPKGARVVVP